MTDFNDRLDLILENNGGGIEVLSISPTRFLIQLKALTEEMAERVAANLEGKKAENIEIDRAIAGGLYVEVHIIAFNEDRVRQFIMELL